MTDLNLQGDYVYSLGSMVIGFNEFWHFQYARVCTLSILNRKAVGSAPWFLKTVQSYMTELLGISQKKT